MRDKIYRYILLYTFRYSKLAKDTLVPFPERSNSSVGIIILNLSTDVIVYSRPVEGSVQEIIGLYSSRMTRNGGLIIFTEYLYF